MPMRRSYLDIIIVEEDHEGSRSQFVDLSSNILRAHMALSSGKRLTWAVGFRKRSFKYTAVGGKLEVEGKDH